jgi:hypothetical protein
MSPDIQSSLSRRISASATEWPWWRTTPDERITLPWVILIHATAPGWSDCQRLRELAEERRRWDHWDACYDYSFGHRSPSSESRIALRITSSNIPHAASAATLAFFFIMPLLPPAHRRRGSCLPAGLETSRMPVEPERAAQSV